MADSQDPDMVDAQDPNMDDSQDPSIFELNTVCATEEAAIQFCREEGLIPTPTVEAPNDRIMEFWGYCNELKFNAALPDCAGKVTTNQRVFKNGPKLYYRCTKCRKTLSQQHGLGPVGGALRETLFAGFDRNGKPNCKISKRAVLWILYAMAKELSLNHTITLVRGTINLDTTTTIGWQNNIRRVMLDALECAPRMGGPGRVVEVGEFLFRVSQPRRKKRAASAPGPSADIAQLGPWVFAMLYEETGELRLFWVEERDAATILPIIVANVAPGTDIFSDGKLAYRRKIQHCRDTAENGGGLMNYNHYKSYPETGVTIKPLEMKVRKCKSKLLRRNCGTSANLLPGHLAAFWWSSLHGPDKVSDPFLRLVALIRERFPQV